MRAGGGKAKGSGFERDICKRLSLWISANQRDDLFWRSAMSGGRASVQFKKGKANKTQVGDISAIHSDGERLLSQVVVECKFIKDLGIESGLLIHKGTIHGYWNELCIISERVKKQPFLIAKQNRSPILLFTTPRALSALGLVGYMVPLFQIPLVADRWSAHEVHAFLFDDLCPAS